MAGVPHISLKRIGQLLLLSVVAAAATLLATQLPGCSLRNRLVSRRPAWGIITVVEVPPGKKLAGASWKNGDLWILTRFAKEGEKPDQAWTLDEYSSWGIFNNHILLKETSR